MQFERGSVIYIENREIQRDRSNMYVYDNKKMMVFYMFYDTDAILSTELPVFHEDFSGRSG